MNPSRGEKPPDMINSRSQSCRSVRTIAARVSASAESSECLGASRADKSFRTPPCGGLAVKSYMVTPVSTCALLGGRFGVFPLEIEILQLSMSRAMYSQKGRVSNKITKSGIQK
jgi:hypothetical protein